ncbi:MAG: Gfo/Idh/MocA family oxidoreductase, partial [Pseudomonadota bacterium]
MTTIGIGVIGGGYMGKAHSVAYSAVGAVFSTALRPTLEVITASSPASAERYREAFGFARAAPDWQSLVADPKVEAVIIASPPQTHLEITRAAAAAGKPVFCEKPLGASIEDGEAMLEAVEAAGIVHMIGFNYIRTPAAQFVRNLLAAGELGDITWFRGEHTEDFFYDPHMEGGWRADGEANGALGDLAPHIFNATLALMGPVRSVMAEVETVHTMRGES